MYCSRPSFGNARQHLIVFMMSRKLCTRGTQSPHKAAQLYRETVQLGRLSPVDILVRIVLASGVFLDLLEFLPDCLLATRGLLESPIQMIVFRIDESESVSEFDLLLCEFRRFFRSRSQLRRLLLCFLLALLVAALGLTVFVWFAGFGAQANTGLRAQREVAERRPARPTRPMGQRLAAAQAVPRVRARDCQSATRRPPGS
mmetsp:Transcript_47684/g.120043  ORF Transcript_47684/g.120043 Transcript_47684/m.120043 type:complete len:201 (+) Transcript_47684:1269-1871(+)